MEKRILEDGKDRILRLSAEPETDLAYELRMISHSQPKELLPVRVNRVPGHTDYDYPVTGLASLKDCEGRDSADYLYSVIFALERLGETLSEHLLSADRVVLDPELIFLKKETGTVSFCYFPGKERPFQDALQSLMEYFLNIIEPLGEAEVLLLYGLYQKAREPNAGPGTLADFWRENRGNEKIREEETRALAPREPGTLTQSEREDRAIYRELGLQEDAVSRPFLRWKAREEPVSDETDSFGEIGTEKEKEAEEISKDSKLLRFIRKNGLEMAAAAVVAAGLIVYLNR